MTSSQSTGWSAPISYVVSLFSIMTYGYFFVVFCWFGAWLLNLSQMESIQSSMGSYLPCGSFNDPNPISFLTNFYLPTHPVLANLVLTALFTLPHSIMARPAMKQFVGEAQGEGQISAYRSLYVCYSAGSLHMVMKGWQIIPGNDLWNVEDSQLKRPLFCTNVFGVVWVLTSTFAIDHFGLFGITQATGFNLYKKLGLDIDGFTTRGHYNLCRHPIMFGMMLMFWSTPIMTSARFMFAFLWTVYILVAVYSFEERDMINQFPQEYPLYQQNTPAFCPMFKPFMTNTGSTKKQN